MTELSLQARAQEVHGHAQSYYAISEQYAYKFLVEVQKIREEKLYLQLGCQTFKDYCRQYFNASSDFVNERIRIAQAFGEEPYSNNYQQLGHKKMLLLARSENPTEAINNIDAADMTTRELEEALKPTARAVEEEDGITLEQLTKEMHELRHSAYLWAVNSLFELVQVKQAVDQKQWTTFLNIIDVTEKEAHMMLLVYKRYVQPFMMKRGKKILFDPNESSKKAFLKWFDRYYVGGENPRAMKWVEEARAKARNEAAQQHEDK